MTKRKIERTAGHAVSVSNRQYVLLREIAARGGLGLKRLLELSQTTSGSVVRRGLVHWDAKVELFNLTAEGNRVLDIYREADISRVDTSRPLSVYIERAA